MKVSTVTYSIVPAITDTGEIGEKHRIAIPSRGWGTCGYCVLDGTAVGWDVPESDPRCHGVAAVVVAVIVCCVGG